MRMKKILTLLFLLAAYVSTASAANKTIRFVARDEVGLGNENRGLWIYVSNEEGTYNYDENGAALSLIGWDGSANWWEVYLDIPETYISKLKWYYSNKTDIWGAGKVTNSSSVKDCTKKSYVSYLYAGAADSPQNISVNEVKLYLTYPEDDVFKDKILMTANGLSYDADVCINADKRLLIIPDYFMNGEGNAIRSPECWSFIYRANPGEGDDYWVWEWQNYNDDAITAAGSSKRWLFKPLSGTDGYAFNFNIQTKAYSIHPYFERTLPSAAVGYATFSSEYDVTPDPNLTYARYASDVNTTTGEITWQDFSSGIEAGQGALLKGTAGATYKFTPASTLSTPSTNLLKPINSETQLPQHSGGNTNFILAKVNDHVAFYKVNASNSWVNAGTAYLQVGASLAPEFFSFDGDVAAIEAMKQDVKVDGQYFNLAGQRIAQPTKGLYIVNGKKVVIK